MVFKTLCEMHGGPIGVYARGHHNQSEFRKNLIAVAETEDGCAISDIFENEGEIRVKPVKYQWWRCVPYDGETRFVNASGPGRGVFPVTVLEAL